MSESWPVGQAVYSLSEIWNLLTFLEEHGYTNRHFLDVTAPDYQALFDWQRRWSLEQFRSLYEAVGQSNAAMLLSRFGERLHLATFGVAGVAVLSSATTEEAMRLMVHFAALLGFKSRISVTLKTKVHIRLDTLMLPPHPTNAMMLEMDMARLRTFLKDLGVDPAELRVDFTGKADGGPLALSISHFEISSSGKYRKEHRNAVSECYRRMNRLRAKKDLRLVIFEKLNKPKQGFPSLSELSRELGMSERTLRRRLNRLGTSYSQLLDERRTHLAQHYICIEGRKNEEIAELLGYSDAANFRHAFRRWTGRPPTAFRVKPIQDLSF